MAEPTRTWSPGGRRLPTSSPPTPQARADLTGIALVFAEVVGKVPEWRRGMGASIMTESEIVNGWIEKGLHLGQVRSKRESLATLVNRRFPGAIPQDYLDLIARQESVEILNVWFEAAIDSAT